ncbi:MAG: hypothetical protein K1X79_08645 [Oligoflexia bacterium]|nr:hypothetical protein [Oligoflexia bacterium]
MARKLLLAVLSLFVVSALCSVPAFAGDEHTCKTDSDCGHGEHCKDSHCHK